MFIEVGKVFLNIVTSVIKSYKQYTSHVSSHGYVIIDHLVQVRGRKQQIRLTNESQKALLYQGQTIDDVYANISKISNENFRTKN